MQTDKIAELQELERGCLAKFRARQARLQSENPRLSASEAYGRALMDMRNTMAAYNRVRSELTVLGVPLWLITGNGGSRPRSCHQSKHRDPESNRYPSLQPTFALNSQECSTLVRFLIITRKLVRRAAIEVGPDAAPDVVVAAFHRFTGSWRADRRHAVSLLVKAATVYAILDNALLYLEPYWQTRLDADGFPIDPGVTEAA